MIRQWLRHFDRLGQRLLLWLLVLLLRPWRAVALPPAQQVRRLLVIRLDPRLGNSVMLLPMLRQLVACFPQATIDVLVSPQGAQIVQHSGLPLRCLVFCKQHLWGKRSPWYWLLRLRQQGYAICFDAGSFTDCSLTQAAMSRLSGAQLVVGPGSTSCARLYDRAIALPPGWGHEVMMRLALLQPWQPAEQLLQSCSRHGEHGPLCLPNLVGHWPKLTASAPLASWLADLPKDKPLLGIYPGARLGARHLSLPLLSYLLDGAARLGYRCLMVTGPNERSWRAQHQQRWPDVVWAPATDVVALGQLWQQCLAVVSADTGPMHLATALGVATFACFTVSDPNRYGYWLPPCSYGFAASEACEQQLGQDVLVWLMQQMERLVGDGNGLQVQIARPDGRGPKREAVAEF